MRETMGTPADGTGTGPGLHRYAVFVCVATFFLVFAGGLVTSTGSGLAVPDWPLSFGKVFPKMEGGVFYEHGHRMVAATVGLLTIGLYLWSLMGRARGAVRLVSALALGAVILQGLLGGLTVLMKLPPAVSVSHACLAQAFLCLIVAFAAMTGRTWRKLGPARADRAAVPLRWLAAGATTAVYGQLILGAVMRHTNSGLAIPDFPLSFGRIVPPLTTASIRINFAHRAWAVVVVVLVSWLVARILRQHAGEQHLVRPALLLAGLIVAQVTLGALTVWSAKAVVPTTFHVLGGAMVLGTTFLIAMRSHRIFAPRGALQGSETPAVAHGAAA